LILIIENRR